MENDAWLARGKRFPSHFASKRFLNDFYSPITSLCVECYAVWHGCFYNASILTIIFKKVNVQNLVSGSKNIRLTTVANIEET